MVESSGRIRFLSVLVWIDWSKRCVFADASSHQRGFWRWYSAWFCFFAWNWRRLMIENRLFLIFTSFESRIFIKLLLWITKNVFQIQLFRIFILNSSMKVLEFDIIDFFSKSIKNLHFKVRGLRKVFLLQKIVVFFIETRSEFATNFFLFSDSR